MPLGIPTHNGKLADRRPPRCQPVQSKCGRCGGESKGVYLCKACEVATRPVWLVGGGSDEARKA